MHTSNVSVVQDLYKKDLFSFFVCYSFAHVKNLILIYMVYMPEAYNAC